MIFNYSHITTLRVRYSETDRMGFCYHGNYASFFEMGRVEALRSLGVVYKDLEDQGILLPVTALEIQYKIPAKYDDLLSLNTTLVNASACTLLFEYALFNQAEELLTTGKSTLVFVNSASSKPIRIPSFIISRLMPYEIKV